MTPSEFWKNFHLGTELSVSGSFIYNGIYCFELMEHFYYENESFEFLYNVAVGIERLQKITLILVEHNENLNQNDFEKSLITHNHLDLNYRIKQNSKINIGKVHVKFLALISDFYKSSRYDRYNLKSIYKSTESRTELIKFIEESLKIKISIDFIGCTSNSDNIKRFIGKIIGKICTEYYKQIEVECDRLRIYTYEIPTESKAFKIFISEKFDFSEERIVQKEIIKFLIQSNLQTGINKYLNELPALDLDYYNTNYYINYLLDFHKKGGIKDEITELYTEINNVSERINYLKPIGETDADFEIDEDID